ncbi:unnamed protein product [Brugia timori]|uniref:Uncharacterized protein n=1 Tax=Brugia timori TaxID=42155 RepID=A0A0R3QVY6_9BILA|nr:unnamed protein product [Brugia timori]
MSDIQICEFFNRKILIYVVTVIWFHFDNHYTEGGCLSVENLYMLNSCTIVSFCSSLCAIRRWM